MKLSTTYTPHTETRTIYICQFIIIICKLALQIAHRRVCSFFIQTVMKAYFHQRKIKLIFTKSVGQQSTLQIQANINLHWGIQCSILI